jgi:hypothetical protein
MRLLIGLLARESEWKEYYQGRQVRAHRLIWFLFNSLSSRAIAFGLGIVNRFSELIHQGPERTAVFGVEFLQALVNVDQHFLCVLKCALSEGEIPDAQLTQRRIDQPEADFDVRLDQFHADTFRCSMLMFVSQRGSHGPCASYFIAFSCTRRQAVRLGAL